MDLFNDLKGQIANPLFLTTSHIQGRYGKLAPPAYGVGYIWNRLRNIFGAAQTGLRFLGLG